MADITSCPEVFAPLAPMANVVSLQPVRETLLERIPEFDVYFASLHVRLDREALAKANRLRVIATPSTGLDHIDLPAAAERGITILSLKEETAFLDQVTSTAELAWGLLLATVRRLPWAFGSALEGRWARDEFRGRQLSGKTVGVLGYGRLGRMVAEYGKAFRMRALACDVRDVDPAEGVEMVDLDRLLRESDVLSIHVHLSNATRGMISRNEFVKMKRGAILINTSRGAIVDEGAMLEALRCGPIAGAGVDVIDGEWDNDLRQHPVIRYAREHQNLMISPHVGGITPEAQKMAYEFIAGKLKRHLEHLAETSS
ncbi:MAG: NAD(P)-dependent oxidoreductase [Bryobacteraceae bacterium]